MCLATDQAGFSDGYHVLPGTRTECPSFDDPVPETIPDHIFQPDPDPIWTFHHKVEEITPQVKKNKPKDCEPGIPLLLPNVKYSSSPAPPPPVPTKCVLPRKVNTKQTTLPKLHIAGIVCTLITLAIVISAIAFGILSSGISLGIGLGLISASSILGLGFVACQGIQ